ncbi:tRNA uridine-5-carboxymethylaminomethyl(34) synthesis GTPase MnmE [Candidatus Nitrospira bockiana]
MEPAMEDTICAIATPIGEGGIGIVRISGERALAVAEAVVRLTSGRPLSEMASHTLHHADVVDPSRPRRRRSLPLDAIDEALVVAMRAPRSYTGEDVVEIHCHGGSLVLHTLMQALLASGARAAQPGEFTKRAFLNGRIDLPQAEAVLDTIRAKTAGSLRVAQAQLRGTLSIELERIQQRLIGLLAQVEASIDFTEEDIRFIQDEPLVRELGEAGEAVQRLIASADEGRVLRDGLALAIVGRPNVGKSSLLNALLQHDRAIVTAVPGTTRDVLEETVNIRGLPVRLLDTAGLRDTADPVEHEGIRRTRAAIDDADVLLIVLDGSSGLTDGDREVLRAAPDKKTVIAVNKSDLLQALHDEDLEREGVRPGTATVRISAKTGAGLESLRDAVCTLVMRPDWEPGECPIVTNLRHRASLIKARDALAKAVESVRSGLSGEFVAMDLRGGIEALGEITGSVTNDDVLDRIFRDFCIGK